MTDDEFTELVDADIPRVDLVDKAANGLKFLIAKREDGAGLMDPDYVRDLIGKSEADPAPQDTVTMTGSPGAIAKLIHEAALRNVAKADMSTKKINDLPDSDFAYIEAGGSKDDEGKTTPRSLRHFPIHDAAHVRNALSRAPQSPFGDKAMPKIRSAAKKFGIEVSKAMELDEGIDGPDPTVPLAAPEDDDAPGDPTDPGSPAWEAIDAATARKWTSILARAKVAIDLLADREMMEAASVDPDDADNAMDLQDACCAIDYAISVLAPFAVAEQSEADCGADMMQAVGKALADWDTEPLDTIEALAHVAKAGRVLSTANEAAIRGAVESLQKVLASLPAPIEKESGQAVADDKETDMPQPETAAETTADSGQEPEMGVAKADGEKTPMVVVYDQKGRLIGIVDPTDVTPVANAEADADDMDDASDAGDDTPDAAPAAAPDASDLTPAPSGEVGTPADAAPSDDGVTKQTDNTDTDMFKSIAKGEATAAVDAYSATQEQVIAKQASDLAQLAGDVEKLRALVKALEEQPAVPKVFTNGAVPPAHMLRGQDQGATPVDMAKAQELKKELYRGADASSQNRAAIDLQQLAIARLSEIHHGAR